jgi:hypothetical protein
MAHYQVKITIQATRLPDPIPVPVHDPGKDPLSEMVGVLREAMPPARNGIPMGFYPGAYRESGLTMGKEIEINAESFDELAKLLGKFDGLADEVECSNPVKKPW